MPYAVQEFLMSIPPTCNEIVNHVSLHTLETGNQFFELKQLAFYDRDAKNQLSLITLIIAVPSRCLLS